MATVQQLDPIYVDVTQPTAEVLRLQHELESGNLVRSGEGAKVHLLLEDGSVYARGGHAPVLRRDGRPHHRLHHPARALPQPGSPAAARDVRARASSTRAPGPDALLVPQIAVRRDAQGKASVLVVGADQKVEVRARSMRPASRG